MHDVRSDCAAEFDAARFSLLVEKARSSLSANLGSPPPPLTNIPKTVGTKNRVEKLNDYDFDYEDDKPRTKIELRNNSKSTVTKGQNLSQSNFIFKKPESPKTTKTDIDIDNYDYEFNNYDYEYDDYGSKPFSKISNTKSAAKVIPKPPNLKRIAGKKILNIKTPARIILRTQNTKSPSRTIPRNQKTFQTKFASQQVPAQSVVVRPRQETRPAGGQSGAGVDYESDYDYHDYNPDDDQPEQFPVTGAGSRDGSGGRAVFNAVAARRPGSAGRATAVPPSRSRPARLDSLVEQSRVAVRGTGRPHRAGAAAGQSNIKSFQFQSLPSQFSFPAPQQRNSDFLFGPPSAEINMADGSYTIVTVFS